MERKQQVVAIETATIVRVLVYATLFVGGVWLLQHLHRELIWVAVAFFIAVALDPAVNRIATLLRTGRLIATTIVFILFIVSLGVLAASLVPPMVSQSEELVTQLPRYLQEIETSNTSLGRVVDHYNLVDRAQEYQERTLSDLTKGTGTAFGLIMGLFNGLAATVTILVITFFMLLEGPRWVTYGWRFVPVSEKSQFHRIALKMYRIVSGYVTGNLIIAALVAVLTSIVVAILGVPYAIPLGIVTGLTTIIPIIGGFIGFAIVGGVAAFTSLTAVLVLLIYFIVYVFIEGHILRPVIYGRTMEMSPLLVMIAIVLGTALAGIIGALIAIPLAACVGVLLSELSGSSMPLKTKAKA